MSRMDQQADIPRSLDAVVMFGRVIAVDGITCRVACGDVTTDAIRYVTPRAGNVRVWSPLSVGEQVVVLSPGGDTHGAVAVAGLFSNENASPSDSHDEVVTAYPDGALVRYNHATHRMAATLPSGSTIEITADTMRLIGNVEITGDVAISGNADIGGTATAAVDVIGGGKSLKTHPHINVQTGGGISGPPQ